SPTEESLEDDEDTSTGASDESVGTRDASAEIPIDPAGNTPPEGLPALANGAPQPLQAANGGARQSARPERRSRERPERTPSTAKIEELLKEGQEVVIQVVKEPLGT